MIGGGVLRNRRLPVAPVDVKFGVDLVERVVFLNVEVDGRRATSVAVRGGDVDGGALDSTSEVV